MDGVCGGADADLDERCMLSLASLPPELLSNVFTFLSARDVCAVALVCTQWRDLVDSRSLWYAYLSRTPLASHRT